MKAGRPRKIRMKKGMRRRLFGMARRGAASPKQRVAQRARHRRRRRRR